MPHIFNSLSTLALTSLAGWVGCAVGMSIALPVMEETEAHGCSYQGVVRCYIHEAPVQSGSTPVSALSRVLASAAATKLTSKNKSQTMLNEAESATQAVLALAFLQDSVARKRLLNVDIPVTFYYENHVPAYAALELPKTQYQFVDACATLSAASLWTADECAADVVFQAQAFVVAHACRSREYVPNPSEFDSSAATCDARLSIEAGPQRYNHASDGHKPTLVDLAKPNFKGGAVPKPTSTNDNHQERAFETSAATQVALRQQLWEELIEPRQFVSYWTNYYDDVQNITVVSSDGQKVRIVEIGTCYGGLADRLAGELRGAHIYAVDPFEIDYDSEDSTSSQRNRWFKSWLNTTDDSSSSERVSSGGRSGQRGESNNSEAAEAVFLSTAWADALAEKLHERHGCRAHVVPLRSTDAALLFEDHSIDSVFIDGLHTYQGVAADVLAWLPKLKLNGGSLIFNDYGSDDFPGVTRAASEMMRSRNWTAVVHGSFMTPPGAGNLALVI